MQQHRALKQSTVNITTKKNEIEAPTNKHINTSRHVARRNSTMQQLMTSGLGALRETIRKTIAFWFVA